MTLLPYKNKPGSALDALFSGYFQLFSDPEKACLTNLIYEQIKVRYYLKFIVTVAKIFHQLSSRRVPITWYVCRFDGIVNVGAKLFAKLNAPLIK